MNMETLELKKAESIAFTGYRNIPVSQMDRVRERLRAVISHAYKHGKRNFYCGMALGLDMLAAETILSLKVELPNIRLIAAVPFRDSPADGLPLNNGDISSLSPKRIRSSF